MHAVAKRGEAVLRQLNLAGIPAALAEIDLGVDKACAALSTYGDTLTSRSR